MHQAEVSPQEKENLYHNQNVHQAEVAPQEKDPKIYTPPEKMIQCKEKWHNNQKLYLFQL